MIESSELRSEDFRDAFGEQGVKWYALGDTFEQARARYIAKLESENRALRRKLRSRGVDPENEACQI